MAKIDDGGPAFPEIVAVGPSGDIYPGIGGMSTRDWFAGQAMAGIMAQSHAGPKDWTIMGHGWGEDCINSLNKHESHMARTIATFAYAVADAMIVARKEQS
jgi:hypothetical protein